MKHKQVQFLATGVLLFVIDYVSTLLVYYLFDLEPGIASAIGFCASFVAGFTINRNVVFKHDGKSRFSIGWQIALYLLLALFNLVISSIAIQYIVTHFLPLALVKPIAVAVMAVWNYVILNRLVFAPSRLNDRSSQDAH